jgi:hypothetical protein
LHIIGKTDRRIKHDELEYEKYQLASPASL